MKKSSEICRKFIICKYFYVLDTYCDFSCGLKIMKRILCDSRKMYMVIVFHVCEVRLDGVLTVRVDI